MSEKIRRQDATTNAAMVYPRDRQARPLGVAAPIPSVIQLETERSANKLKAPTNNTKLQPLFSDEVSSRSSIDSKMGRELDQPLAQRQILQDLLDCKAPYSNGMDQYTWPKLENHGQVAEVSESTDAYGLDSRRLRGPSRFSFVPGDDAIPFFAGGEEGEERDDDGILQDAHSASQPIEGSAERGEELPEPSGGTAAAQSTRRPRTENRCSSAKTGAGSENSCPSSMDTAIRVPRGTPRGTPTVASCHGSPTTRRTVVAMGPDENRDQDAHIAAVRAVARSMEQRPMPN